MSFWKGFVSDVSSADSTDLDGGIPEALACS